MGAESSNTHVLPCWNAGWVSWEATDYGHDHERLFRIVLEVFIPCCLELSAQACDVSITEPQLALNVNAVPAKEWVVLGDQVGNVDTSCEKPVHCLVWADTGFVRIQHDMVILQDGILVI